MIPAPLVWLTRCARSLYMDAAPQPHAAARFQRQVSDSSFVDSWVSLLPSVDARLVVRCGLGDAAATLKIDRLVH
jgi:hypothetical protein